MLLGLEGEDPETVDADDGPAPDRARSVATGRLRLLGDAPDRASTRDDDLILHRRQAAALPPQRHDLHRVRATTTLLGERTYYSIGGGFVLDDDGVGPAGR